MKFLPFLRPVALLTLTLACGACATPANRRALYNYTEPNGVWHDYGRRLQAQAITGNDPGSAVPSGAAAETRGRATPLPVSRPIAADPTTPPSAPAPASNTANPAPVMPAAPDPAIAPTNIETTPVAPAPAADAPAPAADAPPL